MIIISAKVRLPPMAMKAGAVRLACDGCSTTSTPMKPMTMAVQRLMPTRSFRKIGESAAT